MALQRVIVMTALLLYSAFKASAYSPPRDPRALQLITPSTSSPNTVPQLLSLVPQNGTNAPPTPSPSPPLPPPPPRPSTGAIRCFQEGGQSKMTDVDGCRPTLNYFRSFPNYRLVQEFIEHRKPKLPSKPPYAVHHVLSNCAVQIAPDNPGDVDKFSFERARALATEILETCVDHGGRGGTAPIGRDNGWRVTVIGYGLPPRPPGPTPSSRLSAEA